MNIYNNTPPRPLAGRRVLELAQVLFVPANTVAENFPSVVIPAGNRQGAND